MRPKTLRRYARQAGFRDLSVLPIEDFGFWSTGCTRKNPIDARKACRRSMKNGRAA